MAKLDDAHDLLGLRRMTVILGGPFWCAVCGWVMSVVYSRYACPLTIYCRNTDCPECGVRYGVPKVPVEVKR